MTTRPSTAFEQTSSPRNSRRTILGLALGIALGGISVPASLAVAKPKRQPKAGGTPNADA